VQIINAYKILVEKLERKRPLGIPRGRWGNNIKIYPTEILCAVVE
jgi:hypothetical protein